MKHVIVKEVDGTVHMLPFTPGITGLDVQKQMAEKYETEIDNVRLIGRGSVLTEADLKIKLKMNPEEYLICNIIIPREKTEPRLDRTNSSSLLREQPKNMKVLADMGL